MQTLIMDASISGEEGRLSLCSFIPSLSFTLTCICNVVGWHVALLLVLLACLRTLRGSVHVMV
jgi:hypothetical protein